MESVRILVADNHEIVRLGVRSILQSELGWEICGEAANAEQLVERVEALKPDIVVTELVMPGASLLDAVLRILSARPDQKILAFTHYNSEALALKALQAGIRGLLLKSDAGSELRAAIDAVTRGGLYFARTISETILQGFLQGDESFAADLRYSRILTARENDILAAIACGMSNRRTSKILAVSAKTVENHRSNIMRKLDLHSAAELVLYALRNHIILVNDRRMASPSAGREAQVSSAPKQTVTPANAIRMSYEGLAASAATASAIVG
jgi:DNA-binding NarL/FixJ family response regulator